MTDWDSRAEELVRDKAAAWEHQRQELMAKEQALREKAEAVRRKLLDVVGWAIARYQAARIPPMPIYVEWDEEIKLKFRKARKEGRRSQIGQVYPLRRYYQRKEGGEISGPYNTYNIWASTEDSRIFGIYLGDDRYPASNRGKMNWKEVTEIILQGRTGSGNELQLETYFTQLAPSLSLFLSRKKHISYDDYSVAYGVYHDGPVSLPGNCDEFIGLDAVCDEIAEYVQSHTNPKYPPVSF